MNASEDETRLPRLGFALKAGVFLALFLSILLRFDGRSREVLDSSLAQEKGHEEDLRDPQVTGQRRDTDSGQSKNRSRGRGRRGFVPKDRLGYRMFDRRSARRPYAPNSLSGTKRRDGSDLPVFPHPIPVKDIRAAVKEKTPEMPHDRLQSGRAPFGQALVQDAFDRARADLKARGINLDPELKQVLLNGILKKLRSQAPAMDAISKAKAARGNSNSETEARRWSESQETPFRTLGDIID